MTQERSLKDFSIYLRPNKDQEKTRVLPRPGFM